MERVTAKSVDAKIETHEEICALRYEAIHTRLGKMEALFMKAIWSLLGVMSAVIGALLLMRF